MKTTSIASLLTIAAILATPAVTFAQDDREAQQLPAEQNEKVEYSKNVKRLLEGKRVTLMTQAVGPIELKAADQPGLINVSLTYKGRPMVGEGTFLLLQGKGGENKLHVALYYEDDMKRVEQQMQQEEAAAAQSGASQALVGQQTAAQSPPSEQASIDPPALEMTITVLDESLILCESPTILGESIRIGGEVVKAVIGLFALSVDYLRHILVDKVWNEFLVEFLAKHIVRDVVAKQFFRDLVAKKIFRDLVWKKVIVEILAKKVFRDAIGKKFFRDIIWRKGIKGPAKWFAREFFSTTKPCNPESKIDATVEIVEPSTGAAAEQGLPLQSTPRRGGGEE